MTCNPYGCSDDGNLTTFGYWEASYAYLLGKDGQKLDGTEDYLELKQEQGPFDPIKESLDNDKSNIGNMGTATPAQFNIKANVRNYSLNTPNTLTESSSKVSAKGQRRNSQQKLDLINQSKK